MEIIQKRIADEANKSLTHEGPNVLPKIDIMHEPSNSTIEQLTQGPVISPKTVDKNPINIPLASSTLEPPSSVTVDDFPRRGSHSRILWRMILMFVWALRRLKFPLVLPRQS